MNRFLKSYTTDANLINIITLIKVNRKDKLNAPRFYKYTDNLMRRDALDQASCKIRFQNSPKSGFM